MKIKANATPASTHMVNDELIISIACSLASGKKRMSVCPSPNSEKHTSNQLAEIAAEAMPIFSVEYNLAATIQNTNPNRPGTAMSSIR
jgi:hypothetical protein